LQKTPSLDTLKDMNEINVLWKKLVIWAFEPKRKKLLGQMLLGPCFLLTTSTLILLIYAPYNAVLLLLSIFALALFQKESYKINVSVITAISIFAFFTSSYIAEDLKFFNVLWLCSLILGLVISAYFVAKTKAFFRTKLKENTELEKELKLWQSRFETVKEKIDQDRQILEQEIESVQLEVQEKQKYITSLKTLINVAHRESNDATKKLIKQSQDQKETKERLHYEGKLVDNKELKRIIDELNFFRTEHHQKTILLDEANEKLKKQVDAIEQRQKHHQTLLGTTASKSISLQDLAKGISK